MINSILKHDKKEQNLKIVENLLNDAYLLPRWEKIKEIALLQRKFFFSYKSIQTSLFRKFSSKNSLEKYALKDDHDKLLGNMDLRVYKDSVYIINLNIEQGFDFDQVINILLQVAVEKALYNTTNKQLKINLLFPLLIKNKIKKILIAEDFISAENQSTYEKNMFGETYVLNINSSIFWQKKIKQMHFLINK